MGIVSYNKTAYDIIHPVFTAPPFWWILRDEQSRSDRSFENTIIENLYMGVKQMGGDRNIHVCISAAFYNMFKLRSDKPYIYIYIYTHTRIHICKYPLRTCKQWCRHVCLAPRGLPSTADPPLWSLINWPCEHVPLETCTLRFWAQGNYESFVMDWSRLVSNLLKFGQKTKNSKGLYAPRVQVRIFEERAFSDSGTSSGVFNPTRRQRSSTSPPSPCEDSRLAEYCWTKYCGNCKITMMVSELWKGPPHPFNRTPLSDERRGSSAPACRAPPPRGARASLISGSLVKGNPV